MKREIKFRAWIPSSKQMIEDGLIIITTEYGEGSVGIDSRLQEGEALKGLIWTQFTGLLDKKGKEIYEGDILIWNQWQQEGTEKPDLYKIYYEAPSFKAEWYRDGQAGESDLLNSPENFEVIGNIYENPELLK